MWESPIYKMNQHLGTDADGNQVYKEIVIDVTRSAPPFPTPGKTLEATLSRILSLTGVHKTDCILDFGAGKLRNALYLLRRGYRVCAVEFEDLFRDSGQARTAWSSASRYRSRFSTLIYPHQFNECRDTFDLVLLINVLNIMPVPSERLLVLQRCHQRLASGGHLLWYTQRGDADYRGRLIPDYRVGDGYYVGRNAKYKTFYREFTAAEIDELLANGGFQLVQSIPAASRNQARLYRRLDAPAPLAKILTAQAIDAARVIDDRIPTPDQVAPRIIAASGKRRTGNPDPDSLKVEALYIKKLRKIPPGKASAAKYQLHVRDMLRVLFGKELHDLRIEQDVFSALKRLDILTTNKSRAGFFFSLKQDHNVHCPTIVIECKNYRHEVGNPEFDQLGSRLGRKLGRFGILAYRRAANRKRVISRCREFFTNDDKIILPLSDADFERLLRLKMQNQETEIERFLDRLLFEVKAG